MTSSSEKGPREFRLEVEAWRTNAFSWDAENPNHIEFGEQIHVIEYSAYNQAVYERDRAKADRDKYLNALQAQLDIAMKAIQKCTADTSLLELTPEIMNLKVNLILVKAYSEIEKLKGGA